MRLEGLVREESSVRAELDGFGEVVFSGDAPGPVIHRTPEELGIARVVPDLPVRRVLDVRPDFEDLERLCGRGTMREKRLKRGRIPVRRVIGGVQVRMPAKAVMGAEMIDPLMAEQRSESASQRVSKLAEEMQMPRGVYERGVTAAVEVAAKILAEPVDVSPKVIAEKYGVPVWKVADLRYQARKRGELPPVVHKAKPPSRGASKPGAALARTIDVDPQAKGSASSLLGALAKVDAAAAPVVNLALSAAEVAAIFGKLGPAQQSAFLAAGIKAALLS